MRPALVDSDGLERTEGAPDADGPALEEFHEELRRRNLPVLFWSASIFNVAYVAWAGFDYFLARHHWTQFLALRLVASTINTVVAVAAQRPKYRRFAWEAFWVWLFVFGAFISPMLPRVPDALLAYVVGFTLIVYAAGLLPYWKPSWAISNVVSVILTIPAAFVFEPSRLPVRDLVAAGFFVLTAGGLSVVMALFKYDLAKRDYFTRRELEAAVRRESDANARLANATADLERALEKLKELDRLKSKFFANISHELRTPLTLILSPVEELVRSATDPQQRQHLTVVRRNAERLLRLIDDLLDLSRLDARGLRLNVAEVDIHGLAVSVCENCRPAAMVKSQELVVTAEGTIRRIHGDAHRLEIVLTNLIGNALKYTPAGGRIEIRIDELGDAVRVEIQDSGEGIATEELPYIFERFFQIERRDRRRQGGVGIGLALAKELVELHGGTITVTSELGKGSCFAVSVPLGPGHIRPEVIERRQRFSGDVRTARRADDVGVPANDAGNAPAAAPARASEPPPIEQIHFEGRRRPRIVLVEDQEELRAFILGLLTPMFDVTTASDGDEGWDRVQKLHPDLVISDIMMPGRTGTELCQAIKLDKRLHATPVILLTARVGSEATLEGFAHGADEFVAKPFHPAVLLARVRAQLKLRALGLQLAEREKLVAVGTLAAGILHEVRNPVNAILNGAEVLTSGNPSDKTRTALVDVIRDGAKRIQSITASLESHVRPAEDAGTSVLDVREGLDATVALMKHQMSNVEVLREYTSTPSIVGQAGRLNQVFLNLIDNALKSGARHLSLGISEQNGVVRVRIGDDGSGIPPSVAKRVFDPFFTTRDPGVGMGLGLYICRSVVEDHGGKLWFEPRPEGGTEFIIELPMVTERHIQPLTATA